MESRIESFLWLLDEVDNFMQKKLKYYDRLSYFKVGFLVLVFISSFLGAVTYRRSSEKSNYTKVVSQFTQSSVSEVINKVDRGENFYLFIGVSSCSDCQQFAKKLEFNLKDKGIDSKTVYYIGFDNFEDLHTFSGVGLDKLVEGSEGVPIFKRVKNKQIDIEYNEPGDLGSYLVGE